jgi:hypothetical protein
MSGVYLKGWIGVDLDGTLSMDMPGEPFNPFKIGPPVPRMVEIVKEHLRDGYEVRIFTARACTKDHETIFDGSREEYSAKVTDVIRAWCFEHIGTTLEVTCEKDYEMRLFYDDRARQVVRNVGRVIGNG